MGLFDLVREEEAKKKAKKSTIAEGQMSIFDL